MMPRLLAAVLLAMVACSYSTDGLEAPAEDTGGTAHRGPMGVDDAGADLVAVPDAGPKASQEAMSAGGHVGTGGVVGTGGKTTAVGTGGATFGAGGSVVGGVAGSGGSAVGGASGAQPDAGVEPTDTRPADGLQMWDGMTDSQIGVVTLMQSASNDAGWNGIASRGVCCVRTTTADGKPDCWCGSIEPWCVKVGPNCMAAATYPSCLPLNCR